MRRSRTLSAISICPRGGPRQMIPPAGPPGNLCGPRFLGASCSGRRDATPSTWRPLLALSRMRSLRQSAPRSRRFETSAWPCDGFGCVHGDGSLGLNLAASHWQSTTALAATRQSQHAAPFACSNGRISMRQFGWLRQVIACPSDLRTHAARGTNPLCLGTLDPCPTIA